MALSLFMQLLHAHMRGHPLLPWAPLPLLSSEEGEGDGQDGDDDDEEEEKDGDNGYEDEDEEEYEEGGGNKRIVREIVGRGKFLAGEHVLKFKRRLAEENTKGQATGKLSSFFVIKCRIFFNF